MTDEQATLTQPATAPTSQKKEEKRPSTGGGHRSKKSNASRSNAGPANAGNSAGGGPRPSSRGSNKKAASSASADTADSNKKRDSEAKKSNDGKKPEQRNNGSNANNVNKTSNQGRTSNNGGGNNGHKKGQSQSATRQSGSNSNNTSKESSTPPVPILGSESTDALTSLQRVITDLKSISPPFQPPVVSNLPPTAPVFHPGTLGLPAAAAAAAKHRKAASLGAQVNPPPVFSLPSQQFSPMASMHEDNEGQPSFEEGEISEDTFVQSSLNPNAPRFAALNSNQQRQNEVYGPSGRPKLAPAFVFGARRRAASNVPLGPPINEEEDAGFQFPQQNQQPDFTLESSAPSNNEPRGPLPNIMREQVSLASPNFFSSPFTARYSLLSKVRSRLFNSSNSNSCISRSLPIKLWVPSTCTLLLVPMFTDGSKASKSPILPWVQTSITSAWQDSVFLEALILETPVMATGDTAGATA